MDLLSGFFRLLLNSTGVFTDRRIADGAMCHSNVKRLIASWRSHGTIKRVEPGREVEGGFYLEIVSSRKYGWKLLGIRYVAPPAAPPVAGAGPKNRGSFPAIVPLNNPWELRALGVTQQAPAAGEGPVAGTRSARQPLYWWRLDTPTEEAGNERKKEHTTKTRRHRVS